MKIILIGGGRPIYFLAQAFLGKDHELTIVNSDPLECSHLAGRLKARIVLGDGSDQTILEEAGARMADLVLAATPSDPDNLIACQIAQSRFGVRRVVALVNDPDNKEIFEGMGIGAISTSLRVASLIEQQLTFDQVTNLIPAGDGKVMISEVTLAESFPMEGKRIAEIDFPRDALIAVVMREGETIIPRGDTILGRGDRVLLVALSGSREQALRLLTGHGA